MGDGDGWGWETRGALKTDENAQDGGEEICDWAANESVDGGSGWEWETGDGEMDDYEHKMVVE